MPGGPSPEQGLEAVGFEEEAERLTVLSHSSQLESGARLAQQNALLIEEIDALRAPSARKRYRAALVSHWWRINRRYGN